MESYCDTLNLLIEVHDRLCTYRKTQKTVNFTKDMATLSPEDEEAQQQYQDAQNRLLNRGLELDGCRSRLQASGLWCPEYPHEQDFVAHNAHVEPTLRDRLPLEYQMLIKQVVVRDKNPWKDIRTALEIELRRIKN